MAVHQLVHVSYPSLSMLLCNQLLFYIPLAVDCGFLGNPSNGAVDTSSGTTFMLTANYTCNTGYTLTGDMTRICGADAMWMPAIAPTCDRK